jgi:Tfp pilus assembly protein PilO
MKQFDKINGLLSRINEKNQYYILGGLLIFIFLFDYFVLMQWQLRILRNLNPKISTLANDLKDANNNFQRAQQFQTEAARLREQVQKLNKSIISKEEIPSLLENISRMAQDVGVQLDQIKPLAGLGAPILEDKDGKYYAFPIQINARGGYHDIGRFFNKIETAQAFLSIKNFQLVASPEDTSRHLARLTIEAIISEGKRP